MSRLTLDEAITHCKEKSNCSECGKDHEQLAVWLTELQRYKNLKEQGRLVEVIRCKNCIRYGDEYVAGAGWCDEHEHLTNDDDYCSYAEAKLAEMGVRNNGCKRIS